MTAQETFVSIGAESTLSSALSSGATTINVTSTASFPSVPFYAVIDPDVDAKREVVLVDGSTTATTFVLSASSKRGVDGTTDTSHDSGAKVACVPVPALWTDINDRVDSVSTTASAAYKPGGTDVAISDGGTGASDAATARTNLGLVIGTNVQAYSAVLQNTTASFTAAKDIKLTGIETGADVTDATNVAAAGAVMESDTTTAAMSFVVDEDDMASNSETKVPTQQSVKAYVDTATAGGSGVITAVKAADETVASSTTLQNDDHLLFAAEANTTYQVELTLLCSAVNSEDIKFAFSVPAGTTGYWGLSGQGASSASAWMAQAAGSSDNQTLSALTSSETTNGGSSGSAVFGVRIYAIVIVGGTAGNVTLQWAQGSSGVGGSKLRTGSSLVATKVSA